MSWTLYKDLVCSVDGTLDIGKTAARWKAIWGDTITGGTITDGTASFTAGAGSGITTLGMSGVLTSTLADGTAPFTLTSTTLNSNLNADMLDGEHYSDIEANFLLLDQSSPQSVIDGIPIFEEGIYLGGGEGSYTSQYPTQDDDHVKTTTKNSTNYWPYYATDPTKSLTGDPNFKAWVSQTGQTTNQRFHIDLGSAKTITKVYYENWHASGTDQNCGVHNFTIWGSNTAGDFADLVYANDGTWVQITPSQSTFDQHGVPDAIDPKYITLTNVVAYQYYAFKFADGYGGASNYMAVRRIELQSGITAGTLTMEGDLAVNGGDITSSTGAISFDNENLSTTGTLGAGATTISGLISQSLTSLGTYLGFEAGTHEDATVKNNVGIGYQALHTVVTGASNVAVGYQALNLNTGTSNVGVGYKALVANTTGNDNTAIGVDAMATSISGDNNTVVGAEAFQKNETGTGNTCLGYETGFNPGGTDLHALTYCTFLGYMATSTTDSLDKSTALGYGATITASNQMVFGTTALTSVVIGGGNIDAMAGGAGTGTALDLTARPGVTTGIGGAVTITAGNAVVAGAADTSRAGGAITLTSGNAAKDGSNQASGGDITLQCGTSVSLGAGAKGADIYLKPTSKVNTAANGKVIILEDSETTNAVVDLFNISLTSSGTAAANIGAGLVYNIEDASGNLDEAGNIDVIYTSAVHATQASKMSFGLMGAEVMNIVTGTLTVPAIVATAADLTLDPAGNDVILDNANLQLQSTYAIKHTGTAAHFTDLINNDTDSGMYWGAGAGNDFYFQFNSTAKFGYSYDTYFFNLEVAPWGTGSFNLGTAGGYWNDISYKTITDRGCLGSFDDGVELQDGSIVSDIEAIKAIKVHPTKKTVYGAPMLDYKTFPKVSYKPADKDGVLYPRSIDDEPLPIKVMHGKDEVEVLPADGVEMTSMFSIMLGAIKELSARIDKLEA